MPRQRTDLDDIRALVDAGRSVELTMKGGYTVICDGSMGRLMTIYDPQTGTSGSFRPEDIEVVSYRPLKRNEAKEARKTAYNALKSVVLPSILEAETTGE